MGLACLGRETGSSRAYSTCRRFSALPCRLCWVVFSLEKQAAQATARSPSTLSARLKFLAQRESDRSSSTLCAGVAPQQSQSGTSLSPILRALNSPRVDSSYSFPEACSEQPG